MAAKIGTVPRERFRPPAIRFPNPILTKSLPTSRAQRLMPTSLRQPDGVVAVIPRVGRLLVIRRSSTVVAPRAWCFPGGALEPGEDQPAALRRELCEELGVPVEPVHLLWRSVTPWDVSLAWWLARLGEGATPTPNPAEVEDYRWCAPDEMASLEGLLASNRAFLAALAAGEIDLDLSS